MAFNASSWWVVCKAWWSYCPTGSTSERRWNWFGKNAHHHQSILSIALCDAEISTHFTTVIVTETLVTHPRSGQWSLKRSICKHFLTEESNSCIVFTESSLILFVALHSEQTFHLPSSAKPSYRNGGHQQAKMGRNLKVWEKSTSKSV